MSYGVKLHVWGDHACFTRPEMKVERVSYDVITPSAARGILEAVHWKPAIRWKIDRIHVLKPFRFQNIRRNEVASKIPAAKVKTAMKAGDLGNLHLVVDEDRQQRAMLALCNVSYGIEAHFEMTSRAGPDDSPGKHLEIFRRRAKDGQCFHRPCLGVREFPAWFELCNEFPPTSLTKEELDRDLGWMLYDLNYENEREAQFFRAQMRGGIIDVAEARRGGLSR